MRFPAFALLYLFEITDLKYWNNPIEMADSVSFLETAARTDRLFVRPRRFAADSFFGAVKSAFLGERGS